MLTVRFHLIPFTHPNTGTASLPPRFGSLHSLGAGDGQRPGTDMAADA